MQKYFICSLGLIPIVMPILVAVIILVITVVLTELMEQYKSASTGTGENGSLIFDWGVLHVINDDGSITITALIK